MNETGVLAGVKVVEFAQNAAVPYCGRLLAGMGADVVKIEPPEGDAMRFLAPLGQTEGRAYAVINPGKRSMCLDVSAGGSQQVIDALFGWADIALMGFKQSDLERYGLDWEHARTVNPALVLVVLTAFGPEGPESQRGGYDVLIQAMSGLGFMMNRSSGGVPQTTRPAVIDFSSGMMASSAAIAALRYRDQTGLGQRVDASLLGTAVGLGTPVVARFDPGDGPIVDELRSDLALLRLSGADFDEQRAFYESRVDAAGGVFALYFRPYLTSDGIVAIAGISPGLMAKFHEITGLDKPPTRDLQSAEFQAIVTAAEALFASRTTAEWLTLLRENGYPSTRYNIPQEAVLDRQVRANDYTVDLVHPDFGSYTAAGMPVQFSEAPASISGPSPRLGEHTAAVLAEIGFSNDDVESMTAAGLVGRAVAEIKDDPS